MNSVHAVICGQTITIVHTVFMKNAVVDHVQNVEYSLWKLQ